jgi:hypothetical protein
MIYDNQAPRNEEQARLAYTPEEETCKRCLTEAWSRAHGCWAGCEDKSPQEVAAIRRFNLCLD